MVYLAVFFVGWILRGWLPATGTKAPPGKVVGSQTFHLVIVRDKLGREIPVCADSQRVLPEFTLGEKFDELA